MGRRLHALVLVVVLVSVVAPAAAHADAVRSWVRPVDGAVARPFDPPKSRYGAGHLGADLDAAPGAAVRAAGPGIVSFAGSIGETRHVVVAHAGGMRTSYSFLASIAVRRGQAVAAGDVIGTSGGTGEGHDGSVLHFGLRVGDTYVDPMALFRPLDLAAVVHLAPTTIAPQPASASSERRGLIAGLVHDIGAAAGVAGAALGAAGRTVVDAAESRLPVATAVVKGGLEWLAEREHCDAHAPPADGSGGSGHRVMLVAGIESSLTGDESSMGIGAAALGYQPDEVDYFSYAAGGGDYTPVDTEGPLLRAAHRLGDQLRALQRRDPGREVDLIAHSQGGVVVDAFLTLVYDPGDASYPPLGTVVTLSSPLRGDPLATALAGIAGTNAGATGLGVAPRVSRSAAVRDLAANSRLMRALDAARLSEEVNMTTIGAATDVVVPGDVATMPGAQSTTVVPSGLNAHTTILRDPSALRAVRAALERKALPCQSLPTFVAGKILPVTISSLEKSAGRIGEALGALADAAS